MQEPRLRAGLDILARRYRVRVAPGTLSRSGYLAAPDEQRAADLDGLLRDPDVRAIIIARGGYGVMRILHMLDPHALRSDPKVITGFSDATALLSWAQHVAGVRCIHGPMVAQLGDLPAEDAEWLFRMMEDSRAAGSLPLRLEPFGARGESEVITGPLAGGNLCLLSHLLGTPYCWDLDGSIMVIEDVGEVPYRLDRYMTQLGLAGAFTRVAGALVGDFTNCDQPDRPDHPTAMEVVDERLRRYGIAALRGAPLAHGTRNLALPMGGRCSLDLARGELHLHDAAVA